MSEREREVAVITAAAARANLRGAGMMMANQIAAMRMESPPYTEDDFLRVIEEEDIGSNRVIEKLYH